jgi:hypothetical protein
MPLRSARRAWFRGAPHRLPGAGMRADVVIVEALVPGCNGRDDGDCGGAR